VGDPVAKLRCRLTLVYSCCSCNRLMSSMALLHDQQGVTMSD